MTMTNTKAKARALELLNTVRDSRGLPTATMEDVHGFAWFDALCRVIEREEATEARHAAEIRELKERFSEAAVRAVKHLDLTYYNKGSPSQIEREAVVAGLAPFILPAPDPLVEVFGRENAAEIHAALAARGGKIVWEAGE